MNCFDLTSIVVPDGVTSIGENAFQCCRGLTSAVIGNSVTSIGKQTFYECNALTSVSIGNGVTSIGDEAFKYCFNLASVNIPDGVISIGKQAFKSCALTSVLFPEGLQVIGEEAFYGCNFNSIVTIPKSLTEIGNGALRGCQDAAGIVVVEGNSKYDSRNNCNALIETESNTLLLGCAVTIIPEGVTSIGNNAFASCEGLITVNIPEGVTSIGDNAFAGCGNLANVTVPNTVIHIGEGAFQRNYKLEEINIPQGITVINNNTFEECDLTSIVFPEGITSIGNNAFKSCRSLASIVIPKSVQVIGDDAFFGCAGLSSIVVEEGNPAYDSRNNCNALIETKSNTLIRGSSTTIIPTNIQRIGEAAFISCRNLTSIIIPENITSIGELAFSACEELTSVILPNRITSIGQSTFNYCRRLTSITIPEGVTSIGEHAFYRCEKLTSIVLPSSLTSIGNSSFESCTKLIKVTSLSVNPPTLYNLQTFDSGVYGSAILQVPLDCKNIYSSIQGWNRFANIVELNKYHITYTVDDEVYATDSLYEEAPISIPKIGGYTFHPIGELPSVMPANDTIINGYLTVNKYKVTYTVDGDVHHTDSVTYNTAIVAPSAPNKEGYTFTGWTGVPETMPANDIIIGASFVPNKYSVTFKVGEEVIAVDSLKFGAEIILPEAPEKEGRVFRWNTEQNVVPAADVVIEGEYGYFVTFMVNGVEYAKYSFFADEEITVPGDPDMEWHEFDEWSNLPDVMPAKDLTTEATFIFMLEGGDANGDGRVSVLDVTSLTNRILSKKDNGTFVDKAADLNGDGRLSIVDITMITNKILE